MASIEELKRRVANLTSMIANMKGELNTKDYKIHAYYQGLLAQLKEAENELRAQLKGKEAENELLAELKEAENATPINTSIYANLGGAVHKYKFPRRFSKKYCMKTSCKKMGFTQRASCRPYKNCYSKTRKNRKNRNTRKSSKAYRK